MAVIRSILLLVTLFVATFDSYGWSKRGHDVVCYIAECNLSDRALERVTDLLGGRSMVYYANWADSAKYTKEYGYTREWHYFNMERDDSASTAKRSRKGDVLLAVEALVARMSGDQSTSIVPKEMDEQTMLMLLIHLLGDMHQPLHIGRAADEGGGNIPVVFFVESASLHAVWDYHIVANCHDWSYSEWQYQIDRVSDEERREIVSGSYADWVDATHPIATEIYKDSPSGARLSYDYVKKYTPIIEGQLLAAGLRLASILNQIYGE